VLDLDRPVREYVPWLRLRDAETAARLTLRHLLTHTSGLPHRLEPDAAPHGAEAASSADDEDERTAALDDLVRRRLPDTTLIAPLGVLRRLRVRHRRRADRRPLPAARGRQQRRGRQPRLRLLRCPDHSTTQRQPEAPCRLHTRWT
jgi:CubicO group peptidase (beta-lactamase class C family)